MPEEETDRIRAEYERRANAIPADFYSLAKPVNLFFHQQRSRNVLEELAREGMIPLAGKKILEVGCGTGQHLLDMESWGARREDLAGIDLIESRVLRARARLSSSQFASGSDIRVGDAATLPWSDKEFDIVNQSTVFSSIKDNAMKKAVASEMLRVLKPAGIIMWYDFFYNNPKNPNVKGIRESEIRRLFPDSIVRLRKVTLAPPVARRLVSISWIGATILEKMALLNSHYLGIIRRRCFQGLE